MRKSLILDFSRLPIHQCRGKHKFFMQFRIKLIPKEQRFFEIIFLKSFIIIHQLDEFPFRFLDTKISQSACIVVRNILSQLSDIMNISRIVESFSEFNFFIYHKNNLKILEGLSLQTFSDILHILISPRRDDDTKFHVHDVIFYLVSFNLFLF